MTRNEDIYYFERHPDPNTLSGKEELAREEIIRLSGLKKEKRMVTMEQVKYPTPGQIYKHQNNNLYKVLHLATYEDNLKGVVVYQGIHDGRVWVRSTTNFMSNKNDKPRFTLVK